MKHVIIGNGVAGTEAAMSIRGANENAEITIISESPHLFYYRPKLIDYLAGEASLDSFTMYKMERYNDKNIQLVLNTRIDSIEPGNRQVTTASGEKYPYDRLLLATGGVSFVPPIDGTDRNGVFVFRNVADADAVITHSQKHSSFVIIGGGLLGLETANSLLKRGCTVTVVEYLDRILPRQLDTDGSSMLKKMLEEKGITFVLNDSVRSIEGDGPVTGVRLESGTSINAEGVVISSGIRPRMELAEQAGLDINRGILVNDYLQTSDDNIYAAGDPVEHGGKMYGIWPASREQGKIAGRNMAGEMVKYEGTPMSVMLKVTGIDLYSAGDFENSVAESVVSADKNAYRKFLYNRDMPVSAIVLGDTDAIRVARKVIEGKAEKDEFLKYFKEQHLK